jgi:hypothetical protein
MIHFLLFISLIQSIFAFRSESRIPAKLEENSPAESVLSGLFSIGYPPKDAYFTFGQGDGLVLNYDPTKDSRTAIDNRELIWISGKPFILPYTINPYQVADRNCALCKGIISIVRQSLFWNMVKTTTINAGGFFYGVPEDIVWSDCVLAIPDTMCMTQGNVFGTNVMLNFSLTQPYILLPEDIYTQFIGSRRIGITDVHNWNELDITLGDETIRVSQEHVVAKHIWLTQRLTIQSHSEDYVVIGHDALRSMEIYFDSVNNQIAFRQVHTHRGPSWYLFIMYLVLLCLTIFKVLTFAPFEHEFSKPVLFNIAADLIAFLSPIAALSNPYIYHILYEYWPITIIWGFDVGVSVFYGIVSFYLFMTYPLSNRRICQEAAIRRYSATTPVVLAMFLFTLELRSFKLYSVLSLIPLSFLIFQRGIVFFVGFLLPMIEKKVSMWWISYWISNTVFLVLTICYGIPLTLWPGLNWLFPSGGVLTLLIGVFGVLIIIMFVLSCRKSILEYFEKGAKSKNE